MLTLSDMFFSPPWKVSSLFLVLCAVFFSPSRLAVRKNDQSSLARAEYCTQLRRPPRLLVLNLTGNRYESVPWATNPDACWGSLRKSERRCRYRLVMMTNQSDEDEVFFAWGCIVSSLPYLYNSAEVVLSSSHSKAAFTICNDEILPHLVSWLENMSMETWFRFFSSPFRPEYLRLWSRGDRSRYICAEIIPSTIAHVPLPSRLWSRS